MKKLILTKQKNEWADDSISNKYFELLSTNSYLKNATFVVPSTTQIVRFSSPSETKSSLGLTNFSQSRFVFVCINDNMNPNQKYQDSHWSLFFMIS